jgi:hypothetical protein
VKALSVVFGAFGGDKRSIGLEESIAFHQRLCDVQSCAIPPLRLDRLRIGKQGHLRSDCRKR